MSPKANSISLDYLQTRNMRKQRFCRQSACLQRLKPTSRPTLQRIVMRRIGNSAPHAPIPANTEAAHASAPPTKPASELLRPPPGTVRAGRAALQENPSLQGLQRAGLRPMQQVNVSAFAAAAASVPAAAVAAATAPPAPALATVYEFFANVQRWAGETGCCAQETRGRQIAAQRIIDAADDASHHLDLNFLHRRSLPEGMSLITPSCVAYQPPHAVSCK